MPQPPKSPLLRLRAHLIPEAKGHGWVPFYNLGYLVFPFLPIVLSLMGDSAKWPGPVSNMLGPTLLAMLVFLPLYFVAYRTTGIRSLLCMLGMAGIGYALMPFNSFANAYTIYAIGFAAMLGGSLWSRLLWTAMLLAGLLFEIIVLQYPVFIFLITLIISVAVFFGNHHFVESTRKRAELKLSHDEVRRLATVAERERIGRDLHDLLGHTLSLVALKSELASKLLQRGESLEARVAAQREISEVSRVAREALAQVRTAVTGIRAAGIAAELVSAKLLLECDGTVLVSRIDPRWLEGGALPAEVEIALAMTVREAVTNIQRHAKASEARVELETIDGDAVLCISDNGRGAAIVPGNGLTGMRERIESLGGRLRIDSNKGAGTRIEVRVPLQASGATETPLAVNA